MYDKYKKLQDTLKNLLIRAGKDTGVIVEMSCDMKLKDVRIEDESLLNPAMKTTLEGAIRSAFEKAQTKAQEIATEKTKEILGFDPSDLSKMMGGAGGAGGGLGIPGLG